MREGFISSLRSNLLLLAWETEGKVWEGIGDK